MQLSSSALLASLHPPAGPLPAGQHRFLPGPPARAGGPAAAAAGRRSRHQRLRRAAAVWPPQHLPAGRVCQRALGQGGATGQVSERVHNSLGLRAVVGWLICAGCTSVAAGPPPNHAVPCLFSSTSPVRLADQLFSACYKANARLLQSGAGDSELQTVRQAANRHAAFVLHIRCGGRAVGSCRGLRGCCVLLWTAPPAANKAVLPLAPLPLQLPAFRL